MRWIGLTLVAGILVFCGCKREPSNKAGEGTSKAATVGYADPEIQRAEFGTLWQEIAKQEAIGNVDSVLRQMAERTGINNIQWCLEELVDSNEASGAGNAQVLLARVRELRNLDQKGIAAFIEQAKSEGNVDSLCVSLFALRGYDPGREAAEALGSIGDQRAVHLLATRLLHAACDVSMEHRVKDVRKELRLSLVRALENCMGVEFGEYDGSKEGAAAIIEQCEAWLKERGF